MDKDTNGGVAEVLPATPPARSSPGTIKLSTARDIEIHPDQVLGAAEKMFDKWLAVHDKKDSRQHESLARSIKQSYFVSGVLGALALVVLGIAVYLFATDKDQTAMYLILLAAGWVSGGMTGYNLRGRSRSAPDAGE